VSEASAGPVDRAVSAEWAASAAWEDPDGPAVSAGLEA
jgi:hypothetical protein